MCKTLSWKVSRKGHTVDTDIFELLVVENVKIDTKIASIAYILPEIIRNILVTLSFDLPGHPRSKVTTYLDSDGRTSC